MNFVDEGKNEGKYNKALRRYFVAFFGLFMGMLGLLIGIFLFSISKYFSPHS